MPIYACLTKICYCMWLVLKNCTLQKHSRKIFGTIEIISKLPDGYIIYLLPKPLCNAVSTGLIPNLCIHVPQSDMTIKSVPWHITLTISGAWKEESYLEWMHPLCIVIESRGRSLYKSDCQFMARSILHFIISTIIAVCVSNIGVY